MGKYGRRGMADGQMRNRQAAISGAELLALCPNAVLAIDLDGTLVADDMLRRGVVQVLRRAPGSVLAIAVAFMQGGRPGVKRAVAERAPFDPAELPYRAPVLALARAWRAQGRRVVLATAAEENTAKAIAAHLGLFDAVHASGAAGNLKGRSKAAFLSAEYGVRGFVYAGDSTADLHVWAKAAGAVLVSDSPKLLAQLQTMGIPFQHLASVAEQ